MCALSCLGACRKLEHSHTQRGHEEQHEDVVVVVDVANGIEEPPDLLQGGVAVSAHPTTSAAGADAAMESVESEPSVAVAAQSVEQEEPMPIVQILQGAEAAVEEGDTRLSDERVLVQQLNPLTVEDETPSNSPSNSPTSSSQQ